MNNWKICRFCTSYGETMPPEYEKGSIFPGKGECYLKEPQTAIVDGHKETFRPEVLATDDCRAFDLDSLKIDLWLEYMDDLAEKDTAGQIPMGLESVVKDSETTPTMPQVLAAQAEKAKQPNREFCHAGQDGECNWDKCPQIKDGEPIKTGRHCPLDTREDI